MRRDRPDDCDELVTLIEELSAEDPGLAARVAAALERRELARELARHRTEARVSQTEVAARMGTSQGQVARFESGADTRLSTVARYAAALDIEVKWTITERSIRRSDEAPASPDPSE